MACAICRTRRPRRFCPGVRGDICATCCGTEREITVECPLDCEYLIQAHEFEKPPLRDSLPHEDVEVSDDFVEEHEQLLTFLSAAILLASGETEGAVDSDVREALAGLSQTYITLDRGVVYEHLPPNPLAAQIYRIVQRSIGEIQQGGAGGARVRDSELMRALVFLERVAADRDNGRKRGRAFLAMLHRFHGPGAATNAPASSLIIP